MERGDRPEGVLVLVVGPSGAGKDTLIDAAREEFADDPRFTFPRRMVTRPGDAGGERHIALSEADFAAAAAGGTLLLAWRAHGIGYGVPRAILDDLAAGRIVVVNVSRSIVVEAEERVGRVVVLHVTSSPEVLARRLAERRREGGADIRRRLARETAFTALRAPVITIRNESAVADATAAFCAQLDTIRRQ